MNHGATIPTRTPVGRRRGARPPAALALARFIGLAIDLSRVYNRKAELQTIANVAALTAARQLNGTMAGVDAAATQASVAMAGLKYQYNQRLVDWNQAALSFSASPGGGWVDVATAKGAPDGLVYVRVDTAALGVPMGTVVLFFMRALSPSLTSAAIAAVAVAGRSTIEVAPLAVCALSNTAATARANPGPPANVELVQYGFRRGVGYDLMQLNPGGVAAENFVIDPFAPPGKPGALANIAPAFVGPYVCTGQLAMPRVMGGTITVGRKFPLASLYNQLNSRFDLYNGALCTYATAPPDTNIKQYAFGGAITWMSTVPSGQAAQPTTSGGKLWTVADPSSPPAGTTAPMYGPLWAYARAVQWAASEPATGYAAFAINSWSTLYGPSGPAVTAAYPGGTSTPYRATSGSNFQAPPVARKGAANRRVLNVALLSCPVGAGALTTATVLGIGKFLMTVPATATTVHAEFGGLVAEQTLGGAVELYP